MIHSRGPAKQGKPTNRPRFIGPATQAMRLMHMHQALMQRIPLNHRQLVLHPRPGALPLLRQDKRRHVAPKATGTIPSHELPPAVQRLVTAPAARR